MSCFCAVVDISRCRRTSHSTSAVSASDSSCAAQNSRVARAEFGMVAAAALGDVVEQAGEQQQLRLAQRGPYRVRDREAFVRLAAAGELGEVAQHRQRVLVDGVDVEQVELHAPGNLRERGDPAPEHAEPRRG